jgi:hypothetical protein
MKIKAAHEIHTCSFPILCQNRTAILITFHKLLACFDTAKEKLLCILLKGKTVGKKKVIYEANDSDGIKKISIFSASTCNASTKQTDSEGSL